MELFKLRCSLIGHEKDVRAVCGYQCPANSIISGSRDVTTRIWIPNDANESFMEGNVMTGHDRFVSSVCVMPPDATYRQGLIMTGSNDSNILAYTLESPQPIYKLEGHADNVCALAAGKFGTLISGSWDTTAKVWLNRKCVMTLQGHSAAVWAVAIMPEGGFMLSGSADKTIRLWKAGKCEHTFTGHADCVRGLAVINSEEFLSCSNDASVKQWRTDGTCINTFYGHSNFVYSIAVFPNSQNFVTTSEDRTLKVWKDGACDQTIHHPCVSVWCVCILDNGDIVTGGSDGALRVFTHVPERMADEEKQKAYEEQVSASTIHAQIGDIKTEELPPATVLMNPGKRDGQTIMVRNGDQIEAHNWNASEGKWEKIGNVVGGSGGTQATSGKRLHEGKEYDYVFDVELDVEGVPRKMKLPFNAGQDPWLAAHNFLDANDISQMYLDQVAKFILDQTKGVTIDQANPTVSDPLTGGGRYIPGTAPPPMGASGSDPFTGAGRYVPTYGAPPSQTEEPVRVTFVKGAKGDQANDYFPKTSYLQFEVANATAIIGKFKEFRVAAGGGVTDSQLDELALLISGENCTAPQLETLWSLLQWPTAHVFPALDVLRLCVRHKMANEQLCSGEQGKRLLLLLSSFLNPDATPTNSMLTLRIFTNLFSHGPSLDLMASQRESIIAGILGTVTEKANKNQQIAASSVLLNYAVMIGSCGDLEAGRQLVCAAGDIFGWLSDPEAHFRLLVALGTLLSNDKNARELAKSMNLSLYTTKCAAMFEYKKVVECAELLAKLV